MRDENGLFSEHDPAEMKVGGETLLLVVAAPTVWAGHFLLSYVTAAVWCARVVGRDGSLDVARALVGGYTLVALVLIAIVGWMGWRRHAHGGATLPHDFGTAGDRRRFLGFATLLLAAISFVATVLVGLAALIVETCR